MTVARGRKKKNPPQRKKRTPWWEMEAFFKGFKCWIISPQGEGFHTAEDQTHAELGDDGLHLHARQGRKQHHAVGLFPCTRYIWLRLAVNIALAQQDIWLPVNPDSIRLKSLADDSTVRWNFKRASVSHVDYRELSAEDKWRVWNSAQRAVGMACKPKQEIKRVTSARQVRSESLGLNWVTHFTILNFQHY